MRILDRYILKSIISIFVGTVFTFAFLFILIDVFGNLQDFIEKKVPFQIICEYYVTFLPTIIVQISTIASLISVLFTYSQLNAHNELVAIRASGMNFWQITRPALIFGIMVTVLVFLINEKFIPQASVTNQEIRDSQIKIVVSQKNTGLPPIKNLTFYGLKNRLFFIDTFDPNKNLLNGITIIGHDNQQNLIEKIVALRGVWTGIAWKFYNGQITKYNTALPNVPGDIQVFDSKLMDIKETPKDFLRQKMDVSAMNLKQLHDYIHRFEGSGAVKTVTSLKVDYLLKFTFPLRNLIIIFVGLPFALASTGKRKAMTFASIGIALSIGFLYYVCDAVGPALSKYGALPPWAGVGLTPFLFSVAAFVLIKKKF